MGGYELNILGMISNAGLVVQFVMLLLLLFSVTSWAIIFIKFKYLGRASRQSDQFIDEFWKSKNLSDAFSRAKQLHGSPVARIFLLGYVELKKINRSVFGAGTPTNGRNSLSNRFIGTENVKRTLRRAISTEVMRMQTMVPFLATTGNTAPFIGLFGTVWGIMSSFHSIGLKGSASLAAVAPGISEALVATAAGLFVAIPAVVAFNFFMQKIRILDTELQSFADDFLNLIERDLIREKGEFDDDRRE